MPSMSTIKSVYPLKMPRHTAKLSTLCISHQLSTHQKILFYFKLLLCGAYPHLQILFRNHHNCHHSFFQLLTAPHSTYHQAPLFQAITTYTSFLPSPSFKTMSIPSYIQHTAIINHSLSQLKKTSPSFPLYFYISFYISHPSRHSKAQTRPLAILQAMLVLFRMWGIAFFSKVDRCHPPHPSG